jgi:putative ABC transport system permease protein
VINHLEKTYLKFAPGFPFEFSFLNEQFERIYRDEHRTGKIFGYFTLLGIFISCLGLFGLASFLAEQRTREIGIRKVLGASIPGVVLLFLKEFSKWIVLSNLIAWPTAYIAMNKWLQNFAYRTGINIETFILSGLLALIIALSTVSYQSIKSASTNPVEALKYE